MRKNTEELRAKADRLLQEYIRKKNKKCFVCCERPVYCGHHFFTKASSNALRYYLPNIIPICKECHCLVHAQPHLVVPKICFYFGEIWYTDLLVAKRQHVDVSAEWYQSKIDEIKGWIDENY
jgi:hypothetical protein